MKKLLAILFALPFFATAQTFKPDSSVLALKSGQPAYLLDTVVDCSLTKAQLYANTLSYIHNPNKHDPKAVGVNDEASGRVTFAGYISKQLMTGGKERGMQLVRLYYAASIYIKDQQLRIVLSPLQYQYGNVDRSAFFSGSIKFPKKRNNVDISLAGSEQNEAAKYLSNWLITDLAVELSAAIGNEQ